MKAKNSIHDDRFKKGIFHMFLVFLVIVSFLPFYFMMINATHSSTEISTRLNLFVGKSLGNNYVTMMSLANIWKGFLNSLTISVSFTVLSAYFGAMTAYSFAKFKTKLRDVLFIFVLATMMIPQQLGIIGLYQLNMKLGLLNSFLPLIITGISNATTVFFLKGYIETSIPDSIIEAGRIDGCGELKIFNKIILPCVFPAIATMSIFNFVSSWNSYLVPLVLIYDNHKFTLPVLISMIKGLYLSNYGAMYLAIAISVVPIIIAFLFFSKYIISGLTLGSEK